MFSATTCPQGNFAFLCESAMLDYFVQSDCNLTQIGGLLDSKVRGRVGDSSNS